MSLKLLITTSRFYYGPSLLVTELESISDARPRKTGMKEISQTWPPANLTPQPQPNNTATDTGKEWCFLTGGLM